MAAYTPIPDSFLLPRNPDLGLLENTTSAQRNLDKLHRYASSGPHQNSWGLTIFRTTYTAESNAQFPLVVQRIEDFMRSAVTIMRETHRDPTDSARELASRLVNTIIEDKPRLENISIEQAHAAFEDWVTHNGLSNSNNTRYRLALVIDQEAIDGILKLPQPEDNSAPPNVMYICPCKAVSRWGIDRTQTVPWFFVCMQNLQLLWFNLIEECIDRFVHQFQTNPPVYQQETPLSRMKRMGSWPLPSANGPGFAERLRMKQERIAAEAETEGRI